MARWRARARSVSARLLAALAVTVIVVLGLLLGRALTADERPPPLGPAVVITPHGGPSTPGSTTDPAPRTRTPGTTPGTAPGTTPRTTPAQTPPEKSVPQRSGAQQVPRTAPCAGDDDDPDEDDCDDDDD